MKRRRYRNPPIEEAICEFHLAPGPEWDLTVPGRLHERIKDEYAGKPQQQKVVETELRAAPAAGFPSVTVKEGMAKLFFPDSKGRRGVAVGPDVLSVHVLRPYAPGWEEFRPRIERAWGAYQAVAEPVGVRRIGIRYINRIVLSKETIQLPEYFTTPPAAPPSFPETMSSFFHRTEFTYDDGQTRLITTFASGKAPRGSSAFLLDVDLVWLSGDQPNAGSEVITLVETLRDREREVFESLITDKTREVFDSD